jgi:hypothetical protein
MFSYLGGVCDGQKSPPIRIGGAADHVHVLCRLGRTIGIAELVRELKRNSSIWVKRDFGLNDFDWQDGYGAFSLSPSHVAATTAYIENQEAHHQSVSFQDEFRRILKKYGVEYDERYVWD